MQSADALQDQVPTFEFGANWSKYLGKLTRARIETAKSSLVEFVGEKAIAGKSFLDIGCGSGLFSYAAHELGAASVLSFDLDALSVECCKMLKSRAGNPATWRVFQASILDDSLAGRIGKFDLVYSWGVLHHTGKMWKAVESASRLVAPKGLLYIAVYNKVDSPLGSKFWWRVKKRYNSSSRLLQTSMEAFFLILLSVINARQLLDGYGARGMQWRTDVVDWIGGYPYEFATSKEILDYMGRVNPSLHLLRVSETKTIANNSFVWQSVT